MEKISYLKINDALHGLVGLNQNLSILGCENVVIRRDYRTMNGVRIVGGGSPLGLAPYVGPGMLTISIQSNGNTNLITRCLHEICYQSQGGEDGVLIIANTTASDYLAFCLATERACTLDLDVTLLSVTVPFAELLFAKIAGAMAVYQKKITEIYDFCQKIQKTIETETVTTNPNTANDIIEKILSKLSIDTPFICFLNTHKSMDTVDELILIKNLIKLLNQLDKKIIKFYKESELSDDKTKITFTIIPVIETDILVYLTESCDIPAWNNLNQFQPITLDNRLEWTYNNSKLQLRGSILNEHTANMMKMAVKFACYALSSCDLQLDRIDSICGRGTIGTRLKNACHEIDRRLSSRELNIRCPYLFFEEIGRICETVIGGKLGTIYGLVFDGLASAFGGMGKDEQLTMEFPLKALNFITKSLGKYLSENFDKFTIYDPLIKCQQIIQINYNPNLEWFIYFDKAISAAEDIAYKSKNPINNISDPGAHSIGIILRAIYESYKLYP